MSYIGSALPGEREVTQILLQTIQLPIKNDEGLSDSLCIPFFWLQKYCV